jgi:hypothetical protein
MLYPVYVHKDPDSAYGVTFPDFPGCFSAAAEHHMTRSGFLAKAAQQAMGSST